MKKRYLLYAITIAYTSCFLGDAFAAVTVDGSGICPADEDLKSFSGVTQPKVGIGDTLTKFPRIPLYRNENGSPLSVTLPFGSSVNVYGFSNNNKNVFVRYVTPGGGPTICGWAGVENLVMPRNGKFEGKFKSPQPLQMRDISSAENSVHNMLNVKAVVHDLSIKGDSGSGIDIFEDPNSDIPSGKIRLFDTFAVYDQIEVKVSKLGAETRFWLIGVQTRVGKASVRGWIRQRDVVIWPSRLAVQWNEDAQISGYNSPETLLDKAGALTLPGKAERVDFTNQITRRLPVLEQSPAPETILSNLPAGASLAERKSKALKLIRYYRIATPGIACRYDKPDDCLSAREVDRERDMATNAEYAASKIDVLVLMDATESMDPYLPKAVETIKQLLDKISEHPDEFDLRVGISLYGDYIGDVADESQVAYRLIVPFFRPTGVELVQRKDLRALTDHPKSFIFTDIHRDILEAPYAAIIRSAKLPSWRPLKEVPLRFIIHITDAGNRDKGMTSMDTQNARVPGANVHEDSTVTDVYTVEDVVSALRNSSIIYVPVEIQRGSARRSFQSTENKVFEAQSYEIIRALATDTPVKKVTVLKGLDTVQDFELSVVGYVLETWTKVKEFMEYTKCDRKFQSSHCDQLNSEAPKFNSNEIVKLVDRVSIAASGLRQEEITNIYSRDQSIITMYSPAIDSSGRETFSHWIALDAGEFKLLQDLLTTLCTEMSSQDSRNPVLKALHEFAEVYSNEDFSDLTIGEILGKRLGIPNLERTDFSGRTQNEIDDAFRAWQDGEVSTWDNWRLRACKAQKFTSLMEDEKKVEYDHIDCSKGTCTVDQNEEKPFKWSVETLRGSPTYYVPLDIIP